MSLRFTSIVFIILVLLSTGCDSKLREETILTPTPLIITSTLPATLTPVPSETATPPPAQPTMAPVEGMTSTRINVRAEPSTSSKVLGILPANTKVEITGKDPGDNWWQINYAQGVDGKGWINAAFVRAQGVENLPIITETGLIVGTGTPTGIPFTPTPTIIPAWEDHDSSGNPVVSVVFEATGTQTLIYNGELSSPQGDSEDWIAFEPYSSLVFASLVCAGNNLLGVEMTEDNLPMSLDIACGDKMKQVRVKAGSAYLIHLEALPSVGNLQYTNYILTIKTRP